MEGQNGPRIILDAGLGLFNEDWMKPTDYRIDDDRMSKGLLKELSDCASIYRLPAASELPENKRYATKRFPEWNLCVKRHGPSNDYLLHKGTDCPTHGGKYSAAIRFVMACRDGHLDEVSWNYGVHGDSECSGDSVKSRTRSGFAFYWHSTGETLRDITLECPNCKANANFGNMYAAPHRCGGRNPHKEGTGWKKSGDKNCKQNARIIARQSSSLRIAETQTLLSIRPIYTNIHRILQEQSIKSALATAQKLGNEITESNFKKIIEMQMEEKFISSTKGHTILSADWETIQDALEFVKKPILETRDGLIKDEFKELLTASKDGAPPQTLKQGKKFETGSPPPQNIFEVDLNFILTFTIGNTGFRVTPIQKLRTVTVQTSFQREVSSGGNDVGQPKNVDVSFLDGDKKWYPGVEYMGEGIFIRLEAGDGWTTAPSGVESDRWLEEFRNHDRGKYPDRMFRNAQDREEIHPGFVWWHTLSHLLVRTLGSDSGFSTASIRERVYFERGQGDLVRGGILLYAAQPGNEGTMGGLIGIAPHMKAILEKSLEACRTCSSDPMCADTKFKRGKYNGASCYACTLNPETSCEHRNMWLDRNVVSTNTP